jgi:putative ABC transport system permease protein
MLNHYLKMALRNLKKYKTFSAINILGFAFGISVCLLIVMFLIKEYSYDSYNTDANQIYKLVDLTDNSSSIDYRVASAIVNHYPEVKNTCVLQVLPMKVGISYENNGYNIDNIMSVSSDFFKIFTTHFIYGNSANPLPDQNSVVLTESAAQKIFGRENPVGKELELMRNFSLTISGVIKDFPENSSISANVLVNMENRNFKFTFSCTNYADSSTHRYLFNTYLLLSKKADPSQLVQKINNHPETIKPYAEKIGFLPLTETYLRDNTVGNSTKKGNPDLIQLFTAIAFVVLLLAIINYINLSVARQNKRNKETGIRKAIGAEKKDIAFLFLIESVIVTVIAFAVAFILTEISLPFFETIVDTKLSTELLFEFPGNIVLLASILFIGIVSGLFPALLFSSFNPIRILSGRMIAQGRKNYFRNVLTVFQFTVSIALVFCIIVIQKQIGYVKHNNPGFEKEQLLQLKLPFSDGKDSEILMNKLREYPSIKNISTSNGIPGDVHFSMGSGIKGKDKHLFCIPADSNFIKTFKIQLIKGREMLPGESGETCMINETAYKYFGWDNLENKYYNNGRKGGFKVIGVVKDFHIASLHQPIEPTCIMFTPQYSMSNISLRIEGGTTAKTMEFIQKEWKKIFPDYPIDYQFFDEWFNQMYAKDERFANTISMFGFLAISISCLGILGLAIFSSEHRTKEIGIRKVYGASINDVMILINKDFIKWVAVAFVAACPFGWYAMNKWLQDFAYRIEISWWMFALSGGIALVIALASVSFQAIKAATANPVESLRYE